MGKMPRTEKRTGWVVSWPKQGRTWVPFLVHGFKSPLRWVPFRAEMFVSGYWNRVACWLYGGHDTVLYDMRIDPEDDGSYHCPMCCAVVGWEEYVGNRKPLPGGDLTANDWN